MSDGTGSSRRFDAVLYDFSGVLTSSPWDHIASAGGAGPDNSGVLEIMVGPYHEDTDHPWHKLERGEIALTDYLAEVQVLADRAGMALELDRLAGLLDSLELHHRLIDHIGVLRGDGYRTALVTNNVREGSGMWRAMIPVDELFDVVVDSSEVGLRKPNPAIYRLALELLGVGDAGRAVFLDDVEGNIAGAERAGLTALLVTDQDQAVADLDRLLGRAPSGAPPAPGG